MAFCGFLSVFLHLFHGFLHVGFKVGLMRRLAPLLLLSSLAYVDVSFNTQGRFRRGKPVEGLFVPCYRGLSLLREGEAVLLESEEGGDFKSWLGSMDVGQGELGYWMLDFSTRPEAPKELKGTWGPLRGSMDGLQDDLRAVLATAAGLSSWHQGQRYCGRCGAATEVCRAGQQRRCVACGARSRPRVDPAVLVLVTQGQRLLLGRKARWPAGRYSALAGFVEFGETVEECVVREVKEEAGVEVEPSSMQFVCSQPWLFPRSLLLGFTAEACTDEITVDMEEMEDVRWFHASYVRARLAEASKGQEVQDHFNIPSRTSLANCLISRWLQQN